MIKNDFLLKAMAAQLIDQPYFLLAGQILTGRPQQANHYITHQIPQEQNPSHKRYLLHLQWLSETYANNLYPDIAGNDGLEMMDRWNSHDILQQNIENINSLGIEEVDTAGNLFGSLMPMLQSHRAFLKGIVFSNDGFGDQLLDLSLKNLQELESLFREQKAPPAYFYFLDLVKAELYFRGGDFEIAAKILNRIEKIDEPLNALVAVLKADFIVAPISSPMVWNRTIQTNAAAANDLPWHVEEIEIFGNPPAGMDAALKFYQKAERYYTKEKDVVGQVHLLLRYSYLFFVQDAYDKGLETVEKAMELSLSCEHFFLFYTAQTQQILYKIALGGHRIPKETIEQIAVWGKGKGSFSFAMGLGLFMIRMGRFWLLKKSKIDQALSCFASAQYLFRQLGAKTVEAQSHFDMGQLYQTIGDTNNTTYHFENGLSVFEQVINNPKCKIRKDIYRLYMMAANELLSLYIKKMDGDGIQQTVHRMEKMLSMKVNQLPAMNENPAMDSMIEMFIGQSLDQGRIFAPLYKAVNARDEGNMPRAESLYTETLKQIDLASPFSRDFYKGVLAGQERKYEEAKFHFINYLNQGRGGMMDQLVDMFKTASEDRYQMEVLKQDQRTMEMAFTFMVRVKAYEDALKYAQKIEALAGERWWQTQARPWESLCDYGETYEGLNQYDKALHYYNLAIDILEERRTSLSRDEMKSAIGSGKGIQYLYFYAARTAMKAGYDEKSIQYIELNKARALVELLESPSIGSKGKKGGILQEWKGKNAKASLLKSLIVLERNKPDADAGRIAFLEQELTVIQQEINDMDQRVSQKQKQFLGAANEQQFTVANVSEKLPDSTLLIEYFMLSQSLLIWLIDKDGLKIALDCTVDNKAVNRKIAAFHKACTKSGENWKSLSQEISNLLLLPIKDFLDQSKYKHLLFVPHGMMHQLPFQALMWEGAPLFTAFTLSYLPSAHLVSLLKKETKHQNNSALVVGNPANMRYRADFSSDFFVNQDDLPHSEVEAIFIAHQFPKSTLLLEEAATEQAIINQIEQHSTLVFSTHGILSEMAPLNSSILLANGQSLALYELMGLDINAELVVLSACETALGKITGGDDVIGLSRGWFAAGAQSALVSLWSINDRSTALFMTKFFEEYQTKEKPILEAIQLAQQYLYTLSFEQAYYDYNALCETLDRETVQKGTQRGLRKRFAGKHQKETDYSHPYYWAAFLYLGIG